MSTPTIGVHSGAFTNIFELRSPGGPVAASGANAILGESGEPHKALARAVGAGVAGIVDSIDISAAARVSAALAERTAGLTGSDGSPNHVPPVHSVISNYIAAARPHQIAPGQE